MRNDITAFAGLMTLLVCVAAFHPSSAKPVKLNDFIAQQQPQVDWLTEVANAGE